MDCKKVLGMGHTLIGKPKINEANSFEKPKNWVIKLEQ